VGQRRGIRAVGDSHAAVIFPSAFSCPTPSTPVCHCIRGFLDVARAGQVLCPYCGTRYVYKGGKIQGPISARWRRFSWSRRTGSATPCRPTALRAAAGKNSARRSHRRARAAVDRAGAAPHSGNHDVIEAPFDHGELALFARWRPRPQGWRLRRYDQRSCCQHLQVRARPLLLRASPFARGSSGRIALGCSISCTARCKAQCRLWRSATRSSRKTRDRSRRCFAGKRGSRIDAANLALDLGRPRLSRAKPVVRLPCPGAGVRPSKRWPARHFAEPAKKASPRWGYPPLALRLGKDRASARRSAVAKRRRRHRSVRQDRSSRARSTCFRSPKSCEQRLGTHARRRRRRVVRWWPLYGSSSPSTRRRLRELFARQDGIECSPCFARGCPPRTFQVQ